MARDKSGNNLYEGVAASGEKVNCHQRCVRH